MGQFRIMGKAGDTKVEWNADVPAQVADAKERFMNAVHRDKMMAFLVNPDGSQGERIYEFVPGAERIVLVPAMAGGSL